MKQYSVSVERRSGQPTGGEDCGSFDTNGDAMNSAMALLEADEAIDEIVVTEIEDGEADEIPTHICRENGSINMYRNGERHWA